MAEEFDSSHSFMRILEYTKGDIPNGSLTGTKYAGVYMYNATVGGYLLDTCIVSRR